MRSGVTGTLADVETSVCPRPLFARMLTWITGSLALILVGIPALLARWRIRRENRRSVRRGLRVRPVSGTNTEPTDVMDRVPAHGAVEDDPLEFAFEIAL